MSIILNADSAAQWYGYNYWRGKKVISCQCLSDHEAEGIVKDDKEYHVRIDTEHPSKSTCDCTLGYKGICKHMVALYFTIHPDRAEEFIRGDEDEAETYEREQIAAEQKLSSCIRKMSKEELSEALMSLLLDGPQWQYEDFIEKYLKKE